MHMKWTLAPILGVWLGLSAVMAAAADIETLGGPNAPCSYRLTGQILPGDAAKVDALDTFGTVGATLCLDSAGGSLNEGVKMFHVIWDSQMRTRVEAGRRCESACAIAWLGGSTDEGTLALKAPGRSFDAGATLGYHAPRLPLPDGPSYPASEVSRAYELAVLGAEGLFDVKLVTKDGTSPLNDYLYERILGTPGDSMYRIETVADALMADVPVSGTPMLTKILKANLVHLCEAAWLQELGVDVELDGALAHLSLFRDEPLPGKVRRSQGEKVYYHAETDWVVSLFGRYRRSYLCRISDARLASYFEAANGGPSYGSELPVSLEYVDVWPGSPAEQIWSEVDRGNVTVVGERTMPHYALYDGATLLSDLAE